MKGEVKVYLSKGLAITLEVSVRMGLLCVEDLFDRHGSDCVFAVAPLSNMDQL